LGIGPLRIARGHGERGITPKQEEAVKFASALDQEGKEAISHNFPSFGGIRAAEE
jgi:hypothetical protein